MPPSHTITLLVNKKKSFGRELPKDLPEFAHFTLGCHSQDKTGQMMQAFVALCTVLRGPVKFKAVEVVNFGTENKPLWVVKLDTNPIDCPDIDNFPEILAKLFNPSMDAERDGVVYAWTINKTPHMTIGGTEECRKLAELVVAQQKVLTFDRLGYKPVGKHKPILLMYLNVLERNLNDGQSMETSLNACNNGKCTFEYLLRNAGALLQSSSPPS